jgi:hypothetical protein
VHPTSRTRNGRRLEELVEGVAVVLRAPHCVFRRKTVLAVRALARNSPDRTPKAFGGTKAGSRGTVLTLLDRTTYGMNGEQGKYLKK